MKLAKDDLVAALRLRYDHYSAPSIFEATLARAGLQDQADYDDQQIDAFRAALAKVGDRLQNVEARIVSLIEAAGPAKPEPPAPKAEAKPKAETRPEPKAEAQPEPKAGPKAQPEPKTESKKKTAEPEDIVETKTGPKKKTAEPEDIVETTIALAGVDVDDDEEVLVCGGAADLGDWDPERARSMKREGDTWMTTIKIPKNAEVAFKFLRRAADGTVTWEDGDNRNLGGEPRVEATWR